MSSSEKKKSKTSDINYDDEKKKVKSSKSNHLKDDNDSKSTSKLFTKKSKSQKHNQDSDSKILASKSENTQVSDTKEEFAASETATDSDYESPKKVSSGPKTWKEVEEDENKKFQHDFLNSNTLNSSELDAQSNDEFKYFCDNEDLLGLKTQIIKIGDDAIDRKMDPTCNEFEPYCYLKLMHIDTSWNDLLLGMHNLERKITSRQNKLESLVKDNFSRFVACKDSIESIFGQIDGEKQSFFQLIQQLKIALYGIVETSKNVFGNVLDNQSQADTIRIGLSILKKLQFIFNLPNRMRKEIAKNEYYKVVLDYSKIRSFSIASSNSLFKNVIVEVKTIVKSFCTKLLNQLAACESNFSQQELLIEYLIQLDCKVDPILYCINLRFDYVNQLLESKRLMLANQQQQQQLASNLKTNAKQQNSVTLQIIEILMDKLPMLWEMIHKYLNGFYYYYKNKINNRTPMLNYNIDSAKVAHIIEKIQIDASKLIVKDDCYEFYSDVNLSVRPMVKNYINYIFELNLRSDEELEAFMNDNFIKQPSCSPTAKKDKIQALTKLVQYLEATAVIPSSNLQVLSELINFKNSMYVFESLNHVFHTMNEWYHVDDWRILNYQHMISSLPQKFETLLIKTILDYKDLILPDDPLLVYVCRMIFELILKFYDILYHLGFKESNFNSVANAVKVHKNNMFFKFLILYNQCAYIKDIMFVKLENLLLTIYQKKFSIEKNAWQLGLIVKLQEMFVNRYLMEKMQTLNKQLKKELLLCKYNSDEFIRQYVKLLVLELVSSYDEVIKYCPKLLDRIIFTLVENIYQSIFDNINTLAFPSGIREVMQLKTEIEFFSHTVKKYMSKISSRIHAQILKTLNQLEMQDFNNLSPQDSKYASDLSACYTKLKSSTQILFSCLEE